LTNDSYKAYMKMNHSRQQPFLFIVFFSLILLIVLLTMQYKSNQSIYRLQKSNEQAMRIFQANIKMQEIINYNYEVENIIRKFLLSKKSDNAVFIPKTISSINKGVSELIELASSGNNQALLNKLSTGIDQEMAFYKRVFDTSYRDNDAAKALLNSEEAKQLSDNIYEAATRIQLQLEKNLQHSIIDNTAVSKKVQYLSQWLIFLAVGAVLVLGTIIIRHLQRNSRLIQDLEIAKNKANKAAIIKEQFLANMSHEIRTPINSVIGFTQLLQRTSLSIDQKQFVDLINTSGNNLLNIINDILDISKMEANMLQLEKRPFSVHELCYTLEMMFTHHAKEKGLSYTSEVNENVPEVLLGDKERLNQVLNNLIANAFKFTESGNVHLSVQAVNKNSITSTLRFVVKDSGIGIEASKIDSIFERFEQADTDTTRKYGGTGLGLAIVKHIITMHGGFIKVKSEPGIGTEFIFEITYDQEPVSVNNAPSGNRETTTMTNNISLAGLSILAAEDNKMNQTLLRFLFNQWDVNFTLVETGQQAITAFREKYFDFVLLDIQMPVMDGYTTARLIRNEIKSAVPIVAMTAHVLPGEKERCLATGMNDYISKPLNELELFCLIEKYTKEREEKTAGNDCSCQFVNMAYLNQSYAHNKDFIIEVFYQFKEQYPAELTELQKAVASRDFSNTKRMAHHLKTTVTAIHNTSPLYEYCDRIDQIENDANSWEITDAALHQLLDNKEMVMEEINELLKKNFSGLAAK
jgi:signal transduction histidine kinase/CheY-like chemotaxis protein